MGMTIDEALEYLTDFSIYSPYQEAIDKVSAYIEQMQSDYETRLKADMVALLTDIQLEIEEKEQHYQDKFLTSRSDVHATAMGGRMFGCGECKELIQQKINTLKEQNNE